MITQAPICACALLNAWAQTYYPPPESKGTWRRCKDDSEIRTLARMNPEKVRLIGMQQSQVFGGPWQIVIIRRTAVTGGCPTVFASTSILPSWSSFLKRNP